MKLVRIKMVPWLISTMVVGCASQATPATDETSAAEITAARARVRTTQRTVRLLKAGNRTAVETLTIPNDAESILMVARGSRADKFYAFDSLVDPSGSVWISATSVDTSLTPEERTNPIHNLVLSPNRSIAAGGTVSVLFPNTPALELRPGKWSFTIAGGETGKDENLDVTIYTKLKAPKTRWSKLEVVFNFNGAHGLTAETAVKDSAFLSALATMRNTLSAAGIVVVPRYRNIRPTSVIGSPSLATLVIDHANVLSQGTPNALNIFLVDLGNMGVSGVAGSVPGPGPLAGADTGGVLIGALDPKSVVIPSPLEVGTTMAHEACHFLGLYHTQEISMRALGRPVQDPIADTAPGDFNNLMFPSNEIAGRSLLSPGQVVVLKRNPLVIAISDDEAKALGVDSPEG